MPKKFWIGLLIILIFYTLYHLGFVESNYLYNNIPRKIRHLITFCILMGVYITGLYHLTFYNNSWMKTVWHFIHIAGVLLLLLFGLYDWLITMLPLGVKLTLRSINEFLVSPTLYVVIGILSTFLLKPSNSKENT